MKSMILSTIALTAMGIANMAEADTQYPTLMIDGTGCAHGVWLNSVDSDGNYVVQTSSATRIQCVSRSIWTANAITHTGTLNTVTAPLLAVNTPGDAVLLWVDVNSDTGLNALYAKIRPAVTATWSSSPAVINFNGSVQSLTSVNINTNGSINAVITAYTDSEESNIAEYVVAATISAGNIWTGPTQISP